MSLEFLEHTGDTAVRMRAPGARELFEEAVRAVLAVYLDEEQGARVERRESVAVRLAAEDGESLLVDFLNEIIYLFDTRRFLAAGLEEAEVALGPPARLAGKLAGEAVDPARHVLKTEIKAATFHGLEIREVDGELTADVVFDL